jgi:UDP-glucose 4-epimerase
MKILITGGAGFIGSHIQDAYLKLGHEVAVIDNLSSGNTNHLDAKTRFFQLDIRDPAINNVFAEFRPDVLSLHAAQIDVRRSVTDPGFDLQINGLGMLNLLEQARVHQVKKVIFASSGGAIYGEQSVFPAPEDHPTQPMSPYGITKMLGEKYLHFYRNSYNIQTVLLRYANVYGPRQNPHGEAGVIGIFLAKILAGETPTIFGNGKQTRDYVFVEDVVQANVLALKEGVRGTYNVGTGHESTVLEVFNHLTKLLNLSATPQFASSRPGEQRRSVISPENIFKDLGWQARYNLLAGLEKTVQYFKERFSS